MVGEEWLLFRGTRDEESGSLMPHDGIEKLPPAPPWRAAPAVHRSVDTGTHAKEGFHGVDKGRHYHVPRSAIEIINAALFLRRPFLVTGKPGTGKSSLIYAVAYELKLGQVLRWPINSRAQLKDGLYHYDAVGRLQAAQFTKNGIPDIGQFVRLGPLGTALLPKDRPSPILIDEIDKADFDFPNDLLNVFEEGEFSIPELERHPEKDITVRTEYGQGNTAIVSGGVVRCNEFPFVVMTSNEEREFPPPLLTAVKNGLNPALNNPTFLWDKGRIWPLAF